MPMDAGRKRRRKLRREHDIIEGARRMFAERGYEDTTVKDIADGLDISVGAVYIYFRDKDELYYAVVRDGLVAPDRTAKANLTQLLCDTMTKNTSHAVWPAR